MFKKSTARQQFYRAINDVRDHVEPDIRFACFSMVALTLIVAGVVAVA